MDLNRAVITWASALKKEVRNKVVSIAAQSRQNRLIAGFVVYFTKKGLTLQNRLLAVFSGKRNAAISGKRNNIEESGKQGNNIQERMTIKI
jgi:hypothetical protein